MHHGIRVFIIITVLFISSQSMPALAHEKAEQKAVDVSRAWLVLVDGERYGESWEEAALYFRNAINKELWQQSLNAVRKPLGKVIRRAVKSKQYSTSLPGAPDGEYVVIQYETSFSNKKSALETITPMLDRDGKWRVSGYYIK
jgi:hypothetical protein